MRFASGFAAVWLPACSFTGGASAPVDAKIFADAPVVVGEDMADAAIDMGTITDAPCGVSWSFDPSNFDECQLPAIAPFPLDGIRTFDTNTATIGVAIPQPNGLPDALLVHVQDLQMPSGAELSVIGTRGLILAVEGNVQIDGTIVVTAGARGCSAGSGGSVLGVGTGGGGGGGGGGATSGARGGKGGGLLGGGPGTGGGAIAGGELVVPFRGGCRGASGGDVFGGGGGNGGAAGGALQISAKGAIQISSSGSVLAHGRGGGRGTGRAGGGGGGAGGAILLESMVVIIDSDATVCADSGSGGQGGGGNAGASGVDGQCDGAAIATTQSAGGAGGGGGAGSRGTGDPGIGGNGGGDNGGGGGGGAAGFIRLRASADPPNVDPAAIVTPAPNTN